MTSLVDEIVSYKEWRIRELEQLKKLDITVFRQLNNNVNEQFLRMSVPYIYAHWEGFVVETFKLLIDYINSLKLDKMTIRNELVTFSNLGRIKPLSGKQSFEQCCQFTINFTESFNTFFYIDTTLFSAKSNMNFKQLQCIFEWFGIDITKFKKYEIYINQLVNQRNRIAHGENGILVEYRHLEKYIEILQEFFDKIILLIDEYINKMLYLK